MLATRKNYRNIYLIFINRTGLSQKITELIFYLHLTTPIPLYHVFAAYENFKLKTILT